MLHEQASPNSVPVEAAYAAAEDRIMRMTKALILSEAQRLVLQEQLARKDSELFDLRRRLDDALTPDEEVKHDAASDEAGPPPGGEADTAPPFSD